MHFDIKRAIDNALAATSEHFGLSPNTENLSQYTDPSIPARACSLWMQANSEALNYSGPAREVLQREKEQAQHALTAAQRQHHEANRALLVAYPSAFTPGAPADPHAEIDMGLVTARDTAHRRLTAAQTAVREADRDLQTLARHEAAVSGLSRILAQLIGKEAR